MRQLYNSNVHICTEPFLLAAHLHLSRGRKLLETETMDKSAVNRKKGLPDHGIDNDDKSLSTSKVIGMVVPGAFAVCCVSLCAWCYGKKKANAHTMLAKDLNSSKYSTSSSVYGPKVIDFGTVCLFLCQS